MPLRAAVEGWEPYIWIVSDTQHQACAHLENIKAELLDNPRLAADYPAGRGPRAGVAGRRDRAPQRRDDRGLRHRASGSAAAAAAPHRPTLIVCDDLQNDGHIHSALQREHSRTLVPRHADEGRHRRGPTCVNLATALHREALAMELHRTPGWISRVFKAIVRWPDNTSLWQQWEAIYTDLANRQATGQPPGTFYERAPRRRWTPARSCSGPRRKTSTR